MSTPTLSAIEALPLELTSYLPCWNAPRVVCCLWKQVFDDIHPFMLLRQRRFEASLISFRLGEKAEKINQKLGI